MVTTEESKSKVKLEGPRNPPSFELESGVGSINSEHVLSVETTGCLSSGLELPNRLVLDIGNTEASACHVNEE